MAQPAGGCRLGERDTRRALAAGRFFAAGTDARSSGLSYAKWGGFLPDIDRFDAQFFAIAPREAACLDPQERLFLECAWHALEDSGHLGERGQLLRGVQGALDVGVFVGITSNTYPLLGPALWQAGQPAIPSGLPWSVANRVSFALDLCGPSLAIDTACSSSLTALHSAIDSLRKGECRAALVGAVNLYTHPAKYVQLCQQHMLAHRTLPCVRQRGGRLRAR
ncbi:polyketide synthase [Pseudomonas qingdaonensis]|nr:polyketide synthase [Pseudomonas qingdaonensis]